MKLVIVESPTKARTISKFLGAGYDVESSYGHLRDLPKTKLGIDPEHNFEPEYVIPPKSKPVVALLKKALAKADTAILATDEDREGEAIAWHLTQALGLGGIKGHASRVKKIERIVFHEITERAIKDALEHPREIDMNLVNAQQARRVLDRIVGYKLSPFLWKKVARGLSAGRVQSVALRLIVEREEEIKKFVAEKYWTISVDLKTARGEAVTVELSAANGKEIPAPGIASEAETKKITADLENSAYAIESVEKKEMRKNPLAPFITSTLQQTAAQRLGFSSKKTMFLAQGLYEHGHITYMRTDSTNISQGALSAAGDWIRKNLGAKYALSEARAFKTKSRLAQEAHEAIRPTSVASTTENLELAKDEARLYDLIWRRFIASQMPQAIFDATRVDVGTKTQKSAAVYALRANGSILRFDGFLKIWPAKFEERELPDLASGDPLSLDAVRPEEHSTEPPPRYNEASLIKTLEKHGIGRPSTYAPTISVIQTRNYVIKQQGRFYPTDIGTTVNKALTENFPEIFNIEFTAEMEGHLDEVATGERKWQGIIKDFYDPFMKTLEKKYEEVKKSDFQEVTGEKCELCGKPMIIKFGRFGRFLACSGYPDCKGKKSLKAPPKLTGIKCPECLASAERKTDPGELIERRVGKGRARGKIFWGCGKYPACTFATWTDPTKEPPAVRPPKGGADAKKKELIG